MVNPVSATTTHLPTCSFCCC